MSAIYKQYKSKGLEILFAAVNTNPDVPGFVSRFQVPFPVGTADDVKARDYMQHSYLRTAYVPWLVFIDKKGVIRAQYTGSDAIFNGGEDAIRRAVDPLLAEPAGPAAPVKKAPATKAPATKAPAVKKS